MRTAVRLIALLRPFTGEVLVSILLGTATIASGVGLMGTSAFLIATAALQPGIEVLQVAIVGVRFFGISRAVFRYLERLVSHSVNFRVLARLRVAYYRALEPLAPGGLQHVQGGDLLDRAVSDIEVLENFYVRVVAPPVVALLVASGASLFVGSAAFQLGFILAGGLAIGGILIPLVFYWLGLPSGLRVTQARAELSAGFVDTIQGMAERSALNVAGESIARLNRQHLSYEREQETIAVRSSAASSAGLFTNHITVWLVMLAGIPLVSSGTIDGVMLAVLALVALSSFECVLPLPQSALLLESALVSARRLFALHDARPPVSEPGDGIACPAVLHVQIEHLTFHYPGNLSPALVDFSLDLAPGKKVALVGPNGAGKSTVADLLLRLWDVPAGSIRIGGIDIRAFSPDQIRQRIAIVPQRNYLFSGTLAENVLLAASGSPQGDFEAAIRASGLEKLIQRLPGGLDAWVGAQGDQLSGGERQRVAFARSFMRPASLLILDEPATNLDAVAGQALLREAFEHQGEQAILLITHHVLGLQAMDEIIVMREGRVIERGVHAALMDLNGWYAQAVALQQGVL